MYGRPLSQFSYDIGEIVPLGPKPSVQPTDHTNGSCVPGPERHPPIHTQLHQYPEKLTHLGVSSVVHTRCIIHVLPNHRYCGILLWPAVTQKAMTYILCAIRSNRLVRQKSVGGKKQEISSAHLFGSLFNQQSASQATQFALNGELQ